MLLFRYFPTNCASLLIWPCSSYKKFTDDVHHHITPAFFARFYFLLLLFYLHSFVLVFVFSFLFYFNDSLLQFGLGGYCGGPTFLFFSHVKPNTAVTCCSVIHSPRTSLRTKRLRCCCTPPPPPPPPARLIQHH
jgi:hypothetical protein